MFSTLTSIPTSLATSTFSFLSNRKKTFAYLGASVGGVYAIGQWGLQRVMEASERGRKDQGAKNDLLHRFNLNLQDAQFTVQALLPTVATQLQEALDVEDRTTQLGEIAKGERQAKLKELERVKREKEEQEQKERLIEEEKLRVEEEQRNAQEEEKEEGQELPNGHNIESSEESQETSTPASTEPSINGTHSESKEDTISQDSPTSTKLSLNPAAPAFQPRFSAPSPPLPSAPQTNDFPELNGHSESTSEDTQSMVNRTSHSEEEMKESEKADSENGEPNGLGKSWAEVVKTTREEESAENGKAEVEINGQATVEETQEEEGEKVVTPTHLADASSSAGQEEVAKEPTPESVETPSLPTKSKVQLWSEIKVLSFTRLFTSIYVLSLLTLQTHVQLALLGRAHYVKSLVDSLPPRSPSPSSSSSLKGKEKQIDPIEPSMSNEDDLEASLYKAKELPTSREEDRVDEEVERKYLTFSWWLLHEGWKVVRDRVEEKVEDVVGPMGLKTPVVYGELSALFGEIRKRIETQPDGSRFDFAAALHPPTPADELLTLITGGGFPSPSPPPSPSSSSSPLSTHLVPPPLRSLLNETSDFLLSPDGSLVLTLLLDRLLAHSISKLEPAFGLSPTTNDDGRGARFEDVTEKQTRLASLLPVLTRLSAAGLEGQAGVLRGGHGNEFVEAIDDVRELREFVAIVYASYDRDNLRASY